MKKTLSFLMTAVLALTCTATSGCGKKESALDQIKERGYLIIGTEGNWSPWTYHDEKTKRLLNITNEK